MPQPVPLREIAPAASLAARARIQLTLVRLATLQPPGASATRLERKQAALLAYVHLAGSTPRGRLAGLLWPAATASGARANLRQCLARLRRIAPGVLAEEGDAVALGPNVRVDAPADPGAGELLDGYDYADCDDFARWLQARVDEQRSSRQAALNGALHAATERGDFAEAQRLADALLALDRESEDPYRALMEVAYLRGDFAAAVRTWDRCREMLRQLYGVAPSSATQALGATILAAAPPTLRAAAAAPAAGGAPATADTPPGNLGLTAPLLYGRADELAAVRATLHAHRLVTLLGIGGVGKTSLSLAVAHAERRRWPDGVWFVDMAPVLDASMVASAMAQTLGIGLIADRDPVDELVRALADREMLVVIDNAEHLWAAISALAGALLNGTTRLRLLVTSRQALRLPQEQRFPLAGLSAPSDPDLSDLRQLGALALFEARVTALAPQFKLTAENAAAIADVCRRLDGLPLAIELAAARVPVLGTDELRDRLHRSLRVLGARATISAPRHQTLRATFDWTHELLSPAEQQLLRRLAVFVGGFGLALAEDVICGNGEVHNPAQLETAAARMLDDLGALIEKSLVVVSDNEPPRYRLLEVTRAYALEKLADAGEFDDFSRRHAQAIWRLFADAEAGLNEKTRGALSRGQFLRRLAPELDNLRAARAWSGAQADEHALSVGLAAASTEALRLLGRTTEALQALLSLREVVDEATMPAASVELFWTGLCALGTHGRMSRAETLAVIERAERIYRRVGSPRRIHVGLYRKGFALLHLGDAADLQQVVAEMGALERADWPARAIVQRLTLQGAVDALTGRFEASVSAFRSAAALLDPEPDESDVVLNVLSNLAMSLLGAQRDDEALAVADDVLSRRPSPVVRNITLRAAMAALTFLGRFDQARAVARDAMPGWLADDMLPHMLSVFARLAHGQGRIADAVRLDGAARIQVARMGSSNAPVFDRARAHLERAMVEAGLAAPDVARWRQEGEALTQDEIVALCLADVKDFTTRT